MDRDANYVAVGAFVLLVVAMALSFVLWYTNQQDKRIYLRYEIYFPGTVSGLTPGSPVRYLGVDVGKVARIMIDPQQRNRVLVIVDIEATAPIDGRTRASLSLQGITGLLYIDLKQDGKSTAQAVLADGLHYPVIRSAPSDFDARHSARSRTYCYRILAGPVRSPFAQGRALWFPGQRHVLEGGQFAHRSAAAEPFL